jgi:2-keto-4-pentenoate hydratase/2-oxohepta-3-ene-1,7-dioic acid hydratase in catechol pathway
MRLISFEHGGRASCGAVVKGRVFDLGRATGCTELRSLLERPTLDLARLLSAAPDLAALADVRLLPPIPRPEKILCVGLNYRQHVLETGRDLPDWPLLFTRFPQSQVAHGDPIVRPRVSVRLDYEGELAVVVGRRAHQVAAAQAYEHVAGYTCFNDGSVRDWQQRSTHFTAGKNFAASGSMGPWLVTRDEVPDPHALTLVTRINGEEYQRTSTGDMIFDIPRLIEYISAFAVLEPGDVIATGTPSGVGAYREPRRWLVPGDEVEVDISTLGVLRNPVVGEA